MSRPKRNQHIREQLLNQGVSIFISQGYHGTGIKEILDRVKVPKGSFYNYFESKEHFGAEVIKQYAKQILANMDSWLKDSDKDAFEALKQFFDAEILRHQGVREGCLIGNLGAELGDSSELCRQAMVESAEFMQQRFVQVLQAAQEQGTVRNDLATEELAGILFNAYEGALLRMQIEKSVEPLQQFTQLMLNNFLRA
ncbi:TetR/AcrR family transcriptional regulator [Mastigocoleus testarum]|uniref:TetR family transcriptional regulator n=1 Tax=Mastigocoleus testarum BC008 TaxID=371196 RepID=A0A0V7ZWZ7_9CYAN|nr:TetR/AcrR family transcriptional regulator [Mastigocoleus testarum]KST68987.1 TetR family transcriptional regulator [Mastigocoleus testarum BC008]